MRVWWCAKRRGMQACSVCVCENSVVCVVESKHERTCMREVTPTCREDREEV